MIHADTTQFPANIIDVLGVHLQGVDDPKPANAPDDWVPVQFFGRPLTANDAYQGVGIYPDNWVPVEDSYEMIGGPAGRHMPTLQRFYMGIQAFVKDTDQERGQADHAELAERIRDMLYTDPDLNLALASLTATTRTGRVVKTTRWGVQSQKYLSNEFRGSWYYLATIQLFVEVETK